MSKDSAFFGQGYRVSANVWLPKRLQTGSASRKSVWERVDTSRALRVKV